MCYFNFIFVVAESVICPINSFKIQFKYFKIYECKQAEILILQEICVKYVFQKKFITVD